MHRTAVTLLAALALVAATTPAAAYPPEPLPDEPKHRLEAAGLVTGDPAPEFLEGDDNPPVPAEAVLRIGSPVDGENGDLGPREATATLTLRPATAYAAHPIHQDLHSPTVLDFDVTWTKTPGVDDPADTTGYRTATWNVTLEASILGEPFEVSGLWSPASAPLVCTADSPPSTCVYEAAGPVQLTGSWGPADVALEGVAVDRFCSHPESGGLMGYVDRGAASC